LNSGFDVQNVVNNAVAFRYWVRFEGWTEKSVVRFRPWPPFKIKVLVENDTVVKRPLFMGHCVNFHERIEATDRRRPAAIVRHRPESDANVAIVGNPVERPRMSIASTIVLQSDGARRNMIYGPGC
jgi:hypothetical protein